MAEDLQLTLPERKSNKSSASRATVALLAVVLVISLVTLALVWRRAPAGQGEAQQSGGLAPERVMELALKLEQQGLRDGAVELWKEYLDIASATLEQRAKIWYRVGKLLQESDRHADALSSFYRSEAAAKIPELAPEISRRIQENLHALGKFAALRHELATRVAVKRQSGIAGIAGAAGAASDDIVAELGPEKITRADLDREIETVIERQLAPLAAVMPDEERRRRKEELFKRLSTTDERLRLLQQIVGQEVLYRKARELKLADEPRTRGMLRDAERQLLAQRCLEREVVERVHITPGDLQTYYQAHKSEYIQPARARVSHVLLDDKKAAAKQLAELKDKADKNGEAFAESARDHSRDEATRKQGGEIAGWIQAGAATPGIDATRDDLDAILATKAGTIVERIVKTKRGYHLVFVRSREAERQKPFAEVRIEVYQALWSQKTAEVQQRLITRLRDQYDVVIHHARFRPKSALNK